MPLFGSRGIFARFAVLRRLKRYIAVNFFHRGVQYEANTPVLDAIRQNVRPGMTAVDVGASGGEMTEAMVSLVGTSGRVIAIEPLPEMCRLLREKFGGQRECVTVVEAAVVENPNQLSVEMCVTENSVSSGIEVKDQRVIRRFEVKAVTLDSLLLNEKVNFIKVDAEGYDLHVLKGAKETIARCRPVIIAECWVWEPKRRTETIKFLTERNYRVEEFENDIVGYPL